MKQKIDKPRSKSSAKGKKTEKLNIRNEIIGVTILAISLVVLLSVLTEQMGILGKLLKSCFIGLFGMSGYLLPIGGLWVAFYYMRGQWEKLWRFLVFSTTLLLLVSTLLHTIAYGKEATYSLVSLGYLQHASYTNGGYIGALIGRSLIQLIGVFGTYIILFLLIGIEILVITEFPIFSWLEEKISFGAKAASNNIRTVVKEKKEHVQAAVKKVSSEPILTDYITEESVVSHPPIYLSSDAILADIPETIEDIPFVQCDNPVEEPPTPAAPLTKEEYGQVEKEVETKYHQPVLTDYTYPPIDLLKKNESAQPTKQSARIPLENAKKLEETLRSFGVEAVVTQINKGPTVTRYELQPKQGVKVSKIVNLADDIALNLAASGIRIEAPIPGKAAVGIEIPNEASDVVYLRDVIESDNFMAYPSKLSFALGKDIAGKPMVTDIAKMPHILIAGATGSGKSVCINTLITSILYKASPSEVKLIMIDPKVVELNVYNGIPHLLIPVVTDPKKAAGALCWAVNEMTKRYNLFAENNVRDMKGYNVKMEDSTEKMPNIVIIIDELADLMMTAAKEVEDAICRLAQMARAAGIHLVIATQRPSVDVITGVIKANIPSRLAFAVSSGVDSRTILDMNGAEKLLGKGDMLFYPVGEAKPVRIQGAFISDKEVENIVEAVKSGAGEVQYEEEVIQTISTPVTPIESSLEDEFLTQAIELAKTKDKLSISMLQRYFRIGFNRASRLMESLEEHGIVGPDEGSKPRRVIK